jgi:RHH-type rel operon transcriptional repressor/antitoxin RelB
MTISIRLKPETEKRLDNLASLTGKTRASLLQEIIEDGFDDLEQYYLAHMVRERIRNGKERVYFSDEVKLFLGMKD